MTVMEQILPQFALRFFEFLATPIIKNGWCSIEVWTILHIFFGVLIFYLVRKEKYALLVVFELLVLFEFFEISISYFIPIILKESIQDIVWDLITGFAGALVMYLILRLKKK